MKNLEENVTRARSFLDRFSSGVGHLIAGKRMPASDRSTFETISPVDLSPLAKVAQGNATDIDHAARAAKDAFPAWSAVDGRTRKRLLHDIANAIEARAEEIALIECLDTGQALRFMSKAALRGAENFRFFADRAPEARDGHVTHAPQQVNMTSRFPIGPVGVITPWNTPFMLSTWKIAPALAAGLHRRAQTSGTVPADSILAGGHRA